jgi:hypothetical protein
MRSKKEKRVDAAQSTISVLTKGGLGAIPFAGPFLAEAVGEVLSSKRMARIEDTLEKTVAALQTFSDDITLEKLLDDDSNHELFQEALISAAKKGSERRRSQIANLLAHGILDARKDSRSSLIKLQDSLSDVEIMILIGFCLSGSDLEAFQDRHSDQTTMEVVDWNGKLLGDGLPYTDYELAIKKLESAGLIERRYSSPGDITKGDIFERFFKQMTKIRSDNFEATTLGRLLCALLDPNNKVKYAHPFAEPKGFISGIDERVPYEEE